MSGIYPHGVVRASLGLQGLCGASGGTLRAIEHDGLAVVGEPEGCRPPTAAPEAFMDAVSDLASAASGACAPMRATERAMSESDAVAFLRAGRERLARLLDRLEGREEWSVGIPADAAITDRPRVRVSGGVGTGFLEARRRELAVADGAPRGRIDAVIEVQRALAPVATDQRVVGRGERAAIAALVETERAGELEGLAAREGWALFGPYPAFSFVSIMG